MKKLVLKLDDIGRDSNTPVFDTVAWALLKKIPVSIGCIGAGLAAMPRHVVEIIKLGCAAGLVELWNHGQQHIRYDQATADAARRDLVRGHEEIAAKFGVAPVGFGFPFNKLSEESLRVVKTEYPDYYVFETDFNDYILLSPEYNAFADGQPRFEYFRNRVPGKGAATANILFQAHPPRWTDQGFAEFTRCVEHLIASEGYVCITGQEAMALAPPGAPASARQSALGKVADKKQAIADVWERQSAEYQKTLSNFNSYFFRRFLDDCEKNYLQTAAMLFPFSPKRILDFGCGLGNWSLPFWFAGDCEQIILNDINPTIVAALNDGLPSGEGATVDGRNLLHTASGQPPEVDFLVSANTFNYIDPIDFFSFAQQCVAPGGRLLLMVQTGAFNQYRYRIACNRKDRSLGAEVLASDLSMLVRRQGALFPGDVRHVFSREEIAKLSVMFDFNCMAGFVPTGEHFEEGQSVYECYVFKKAAGLGHSISGRPDWLKECLQSMRRSFGARALEAAGIPCDFTSRYPGYDKPWEWPDEVGQQDRAAFAYFKNAIAKLKAGQPIQPPAADAAPQGAGLVNFQKRLNRLAELLAG